MNIDWTKISERLAGLVKVDDARDIPTIAGRLGVDEASLRTVVLKDSGGVSTRSIAIIARLYGLDPTWVITGKYDPATHSRALNANVDEISIIVNTLLARTSGTSEVVIQSIGAR